MFKKCCFFSIVVFCKIGIGDVIYIFNKIFRLIFSVYYGFILRVRVVYWFWVLDFDFDF